MQNYDNWKNQSSRSAIMDALNNGGGSSRTNSFGSVTDFISGLLGPNFNPNQKPEKDHAQDDIDPIRFNNKQEIPKAHNDYERYHSQEQEEEEFDDEEDLEDEEEIDDDEYDQSNHYKIYRDKEENFECNISVQGAKLSTSQARLILDHEVCNLVFYGKVSKDGKCVVPLKKMTYFPEGSIGRIRLEVIVDDTIFIPWEETFIVEGAKKVTVQIKPQKKVDLRFD